MIYTLTLNPALDYRLHTPHPAKDGVTRADATSIHFGGKGINVSLILHEMGVDSIALGLIAGFTGDALETHLQTLGLKTDFIRLPEGMTRINVKMLGKAEESEVNAPGPTVSLDSLSGLYEQLDRLGEGDTLVMSGSVPPGIPSSIYASFAKTVSARGVRVVADVSGNALKAVLTTAPFLLKPNLSELEELVGGRSLRHEDGTPMLSEIEEVAVFLQSNGVRYVLVSLGKYGAYLKDENRETHYVPVPDRTAVEAAAYKGADLSEYDLRKQRILDIRRRITDTVGAGDSMVAGFLCGVDRGMDAAHALRLAVAAGSATAMSEGLATRTMIERVLGVMESI